MYRLLKHFIQLPLFNLSVSMDTFASFDGTLPAWTKRNFILESCKVNSTLPTKTYIIHMHKECMPWCGGAFWDGETIISFGIYISSEWSFQALDA